MFHFDVDDSPSNGLVQTDFSAPFLIDALIARGQITAQKAGIAQAAATRQGLPLADVLCLSRGVSQYSIATIFADHTGAQLINPIEQPPDCSLLQRYGPANCLRDGLMPWRQIGGDTIVLSTQPGQFARHQAHLRRLFGKVRMAVTAPAQLDRCISEQFGNTLARAAERRVPDDKSCRNWNRGMALGLGLCCAAACVAGALMAPQFILAALTLWTILTLLMTTLLKAAAAYIGWRDDPVPTCAISPAPLPVITMLVPLYNETAIADHLLARLADLDYPRELLDVCLVMEADDLTTRATLGRTILPTWMRAIIVPKGTIKTKPRALNYALDFARGNIIGVWDAEDAPALDQLHIVAQHFAQTGPDVACLQGVLDYYNAPTNWLTRCFTIEYAGWFRVVLPGLNRLGLVVPLGGTTLFFRRDALEQLGGWDAHNVTEDADLGVRLARHGYRTELISTVTEEEANGRAWPWVKQRSRWLKGYAITYGVHMRNPARLWRDLGAWRFFGIQLLFLGTLSQFVFAPVLWTFWLPVFGIDHPLNGMIAPWMFWGLAGLFILSEVTGFCVAAIGVHKAGKSWLTKWALTLQLYFPLAALAAYKGGIELVSNPFYWDKTAHGILLPDGWQKTTPPPPLPAHPASDG
ncbi:glycosyltransferase family 2 protein [Loktanella agnita]|uniref:glycosyltransferase family 2 protein n=1 Tax=Loktanella agnita TaxID=287097 RepID=UPI0039886EFB